jgi:short-subunit dehydrogenase
MSHNEQTILITGAGRGIGRVIAEYFARNTEFRLILISRSEEHLLETQRLCRSAGASHVEIFAADLTDPSQVEKIVLPKGYDQIRALVNNAGQFRTDSPEKLDLDGIYHQFNHNAVATALLTQHFLPILKKQDHALIVNIASVASFVGMKNAVAYTMAKHALLGYTRSLREHLKGTNIAVTTLAPSSTWSTSWEGSSADPETTIHPQDIAIQIEALTRMSPRSVTEEIRVEPR